MSDLLQSEDGLRVGQDVRNLAKTFYFSFEFSQGDPGLQAKIFRYLHTVRPDWKIAPEQVKELRKIIHDQIESRFFGGKGQVATHEVVTSPSVHSNINDEFATMESTFNGAVAHTKSTSGLIETIVIDILDRDLHFLNKSGGRPRKKEYRVGSKYDPWMSQLNYYVISGNPAPTPEYQKMFNEIKEHLKAKIMNKEVIIDYDMTRDNLTWGGILSELAVIWEKKHPNENFFEGLNLPEEIIKR